MDREQLQRMKSVIEKVRVFKRFTMTEAQRLLKLCQYKSFAASEVIYRMGEPSREMLVLIQGKLQAINESGTVLGEILPGTTTGEMGVLTGQPRSATIVAMEKSAGFVITKPDLDTLLRDEDIRLKVYENMVEMFCERLSGANVQIENYAKKTRGE